MSLGPLSVSQGNLSPTHVQLNPMRFFGTGCQGNLQLDHAGPSVTSHRGWDPIAINGEGTALPVAQSGYLAIAISDFGPSRRRDDGVRHIPKTLRENRRSVNELASTFGGLAMQRLVSRRPLVDRQHGVEQLRICFRPEVDTHRVAQADIPGDAVELIVSNATTSDDVSPRRGRVDREPTEGVGMRLDANFSLLGIQKRNEGLLNGQIASGLHDSPPNNLSREGLEREEPDHQGRTRRERSIDQ